MGESVKVSDLVDGVPHLVQVEGEAVMLVRRGDQVLATGASCSHYHGPLAEGLVVGETVRCPWHHACFDLRTGEAVGAPALNPIDCYEVIRSGDLVQVGGKKAPAVNPAAASGAGPHVLVLGAGAAGAAAVESLRRAGHGGPITLVGGEQPGPVDRPNLSKDYLAGTAPEEWIPVRDAAFYAGLHVDFVAEDPAVALDVDRRVATLKSGRSIEWGALIYALGAEPIRLPIPGADAPHVHTLRTLADSRAIVARATAGARAVVIGASFIGLEVAASLRARGVEVDIVAPEPIPLARVLGEDVGRFVQSVHEAKGARFHLGKKPAKIDGSVTLEGGRSLPADLVVMGVGVKPRVALAQAAGLAVENGLDVDEQLRTSAPGVWAAGDVARYPDAWSGERVRVEHWAAAQRQGQAAGRNVAMESLGGGRPFRDVPFFWSAHHDVTIAYVGSAPKWTRAELKGDLAARDAAVVYRDANGKALAVATIGRDRLSLEVEAAMERGDEAAVEKLLR